MRYPDILDILRAIEVDAGVRAARGESPIVQKPDGSWTTVAAAAGDAIHEITHFRKELSEAEAERVAQAKALAAERALTHDWMIANAPNGWIDLMRTRLANAERWTGMHAAILADGETGEGSAIETAFKAGVEAGYLSERRNEPWQGYLDELQIGLWTEFTRERKVKP